MSISNKPQGVGRPNQRAVSVKMKRMREKQPVPMLMLFSLAIKLFVLGVRGILFTCLECLRFAIAFFNHAVPFLLGEWKCSTDVILKRMDRTASPLAMPRLHVRKLVGITLMLLVSVIVFHV